MRGLLGFKGAESKKSHVGNEGFGEHQQVLWAIKGQAPQTMHLRGKDAGH